MLTRARLSSARVGLCSLLCVGGVLCAMRVASAKQNAMQGMEHLPGHMAGHMYMTTLRPIKPGDQEKADAIAADARKAMERYQEFHKALADGYEIFLPEVPQS